MEGVRQRVGEGNRVLESEATPLPRREERKPRRKARGRCCGTMAGNLSRNLAGILAYNPPCNMLSCITWHRPDRDADRSQTDSVRPLRRRSMPPG
jgi:hypothetical protein